MKTFLIAAALCLAVNQAAADVQVTFIEGAPKDRFVISNTSCPTGPLRVTFDLSLSMGALIFDVTGSGAGVNVFQPFGLVTGAAQVTRAPRVQDGDQMLSLDLAGLSPDEDVSFTIDVDDTTAAREITVAGSELTGAKVVLEAGSRRAEALFDASAQVVIPWSGCSS